MFRWLLRTAQCPSVHQFSKRSTGDNSSLGLFGLGHLIGSGNGVAEKAGGPAFVSFSAGTETGAEDGGRLAETTSTRPGCQQVPEDGFGSV